MVVQYLVVTSGTDSLNQAMLNSLGASDWTLVQVVYPAGTIGLTYIFKK